MDVGVGFRGVLQLQVLELFFGGAAVSFVSVGL